MLIPSKLFTFIYSFILMGLLATIAAQESDMSSQYRTSFFIKENKQGTYKLTSSIQINRTYLSKRSTKIHYFNIYEPFYASVNKIKGKFRNKSLPKRKIYFELAKFEDLFISDYKIHTLLFPNYIKQGEKLSYQYQKSYRDIAFLPIIYLPNSNYLNSYQVSFHHPKNCQIDFEFFFPRDTVEYQIDTSDKEKTILLFKDLKEQKRIDYFPFNNFHTAVLVTVLKNRQAVNPTSTAQFLKWYAKLVNLTPALKERHQNLLTEKLSNTTNNREKLAHIHDFVRKNIRYIADERAMHAYIPRQPSYTLDKSFGDCKDRAYLLSSLANTKNLKVNMALVSNNPTPSFKGVHISQYNHVICAAQDTNGEIIFFDPTHKYCEFGNLPENDIGAQAFVIDPENPRIIEVQPPNETFSISINITGKIANPKDCSATIVLKNDHFSAAAQAKEKLTGVQFENFLSELVSINFHKISLEYFKLSKKTPNSLIFTAAADLSKFIISSTAKKYIPKSPFLIVDKEILERSNDPYPLYLSSRKRIKLSITLDVNKFNIEEEHFKLGKHRTGIFTASMTKTGNQHIHIDYQIKQLSKYLAGNAKIQFLNFCSNYLKSKRQMFILK